MGKNKLYIIAATCVICFFIFFALTVFLVKEIKKEVTLELNKDIKRIVRRELKSYMMAKYSHHIEGPEIARLRQAVPQLDAPNKISSANPIKPEALSSSNNGIKNIMENILASIVAGAAQSETAIANGLNKKIKTNPPDVVTLGQASTSAKEEDLDIMAGKQRAIEQTMVDQGSMLLARGQWQVEPSFTAAHFSSNKINIEGFSILPVLVIGEISTQSVQRDILIPAVGIKYGLWRDLEVDLSVPYRFEIDRTTSNLGDETMNNANGIGDIDFALSAQIAHERGLIPDLVLAVTAKAPTGDDPYTHLIGLGTGHWAVRTALFAAKSSDPVVVFGNLNYTWNIERNIPGFANVDPGDTVGYALGAAIALSYQTAINFQYEQSITSKMKTNGILVNGSFVNSADLKVGFTWVVSEKFSINFSAAVGMTKDSADYIVELRLPYTF